MPPRLRLAAALALAALAPAISPLACTCEQPAVTTADADALADPQEVDADADASEQPLPTLRVGDAPPLAGPTLEGTIRGRHRVSDAEYLEIRLPLRGDDASIDWDPLHIAIDGLVPGQIATLRRDPTHDELALLLRSAKAAGDLPKDNLRGALFGVRWIAGQRVWVRASFTARAGEPADNATTTDLPRRWVEATADALTTPLRLPAGQRPIHPWDHFAAGRLRVLLGELDHKTTGDAPGRRPRTDLVRLMDTTSGLLSIQEALQHDRGLRLAVADGPQTIPLADLTGLPLEALEAHPFAAMQAALGDPAGATPEPLAAATPAEFWYLRFASLPLFLRLLGEADRWITPLVQLLQQNPEDRRLTSRYEMELGVVRIELAKILGPAAVGEVAMVGSDPYIREGTDLTLLFQIRESTLYNAELDRYLQQHASRLEALGATITTATREHHGVTITSAHDPLRRIRRERAQVGEIGLLSTSPRAIERVLDTLAGRHPSLAEAADFRYMQARDPGAHACLLFLSDALIAAVIGPAQKIQATRRQRAHAELLVPGYAALLHGWLFGQPPEGVEGLLRSGLLSRDELRHHDGAAIEFRPPPLRDGSIPNDRTTTSRWGAPAALTPLLDLPAVERVSDAEAQAYRDFIRGYQSYWKRFIDPVRLTLDITDDPAAPGHEWIDLDLRILPLIDASDYRDIEQIVGTQRVEVRAIDRGLQAIWAVGADSSVRRDLDGLLRAASGQAEIGVGWVGDWVMLGIDDRVAIAELVAYLDDRIQAPAPELASDPKKPRDFLSDRELWTRLGAAPIYAAAAVKNQAALVATLGAIRALLHEVAPGTLDWGEHSRHRDLPIVRVGIRRNAPLLRQPEIADNFALYYVQTGAAIILAVDPRVLRRVIDRLLAGEIPGPGADDGPQLVIDARSGPGAPLWTTAGWLLQAEATVAQASAERAAEILYRGAPEAGGPGLLTELGQAYLGSTPLSARGAPSFLLDITGAGDPALGTAIHRKFPELPLLGAPAQRLMKRLRALRIEVSFDREPAAAGADARSLHTHLRLHLGSER